MTDKMIQVAREARKNAYTPYSEFYVGACVRSEDGELFGGCNVENASYGLTICAEASAICALIAAGKKQITEIAVIGSGNVPCPPCGACRQLIREFATTDTKIHICSTEEVLHTFTLEELLPKSFGPENLT